MENILKYSKAAQCFNEALPLGNGSLGAMVYGKTDTDRISLNHDTLWAGKPGQTMVEGANEAIEQAKALALEGKCAEAQEVLEQHFTGPWHHPYLMLGTLFIKRVGSSGTPEHYLRELDMENALLNVRYSEDGIDFNREYFVSYPDNCLMIHLQSSQPVTYELTGDCVGKSVVNSMDDALYFQGECPSYITPNYKIPKPRHHIVYDGEGVKVTAIAKVKTDGTTEVQYFNGNTLTVRDACDVTVYFCAETSFVAFDKMPDRPTLQPCIKRSDTLIEKSYEEIREAHISDVSALYNRVKIDLDGKESNETTDARLQAETKGADLVELLYNFGRYVAIASSRKGSRPINLQGIWNERYDPPWACNYTTNINLEMNYWLMMQCDLAECNEPLLDFIKELSINGEETAKHYYHANGWVVHHNTDLWAQTTPVGNQKRTCSNYAYWTSSAWLCDHLFEHYEYTMDRDYLTNFAYPIMKKAAEFYLSVLTEVNGKWLLLPSTSPEKHYYLDGQRLAVSAYTAMSQQMVESLFRNVSKSAEILEINDAFVEEIREKLPGVAIYEIGSKGELLEFDKEYEEWDVHHRHISHLYALYPASLVSMEKNPQITDAIGRSLEIRGFEGCAGWGLCWRAALLAKLKDGDRAFDMIKTQLRYISPEFDKPRRMLGGTYPNLFNSCPPMQIDGTLGIVAAITQLFLQCEDGKIKVLPALPSEVKNGKLCGVMAKGNVKVDMEWRDSKLCCLTLLSPISQTVTVNVAGDDLQIQLVAGQKYQVVSPKGDSKNEKEGKEG